MHKGIYNILSLALSAALLLSACKQEGPADPSNIASDPSSTTLQLENYATDLIVNAEEDALSPKPQSSQSARAMGMNFEIKAGTGANSGSIIPRIDTVGKSELDVLVTIYNKTNGRSYTTPTKLKREQRRISSRPHYYIADLNLPTYLQVRQAGQELYLLVLAGAGNYQSSTHRLEIESETQLKPLKVGDKVNMQVPFASNWRRITWDQTSLSLRLQDTSTPAKSLLTLRPQGVMLVLNVENWMTLAVDLKRSIQLEANGYAGKGYYDLSESKITASSVLDDSDLSNELWQTTSTETQASRESAYYRNNNYHHYITRFTLLPGANEHSNIIQLAKRSGSTAVVYPHKYVLWLQQVKRDGGKNVLYADADISISEGRTKYTADASTYARPIEPSKWKPRLGKRYIIGSIPKDKDKGKAYLFTMRMIRPMIAIEYSSLPGTTYNYRGNSAPNTPTGQRLGYHHDAIWQGDYWDPLYPRPYFRLPKGSELGQLTRFPSAHLTSARLPTRNNNIATPVGEQGVFIDQRGHPEVADIGGQARLYQMHNYFVHKDNDPVYYAMVYRGTEQETGYNQTLNYCVFARFTKLKSNASEQRPNILRIEHYYVGPNMEALDDLALVEYGMHELFWKYNIDPSAIIKREIMFVNRDPEMSGDGNLYWLWNPSNKPRAARLNNYGIFEGEMDYRNDVNHYHLPWLKDEYRAW